MILWLLAFTSHCRYLAVSVQSPMIDDPLTLQSNLDDTRRFSGRITVQI